MSVEGGRQRLYGALKEFRGKWRESQNSWDDSVSRMVDEKYVLPLEVSGKVAIHAMEAMRDLIDQIKKECGDPNAID